jgi:aminopeptidase N
VFCIAIENGGTTEYEAVKKDYQSTTSIDGKEIGLQAMGHVQSVDLMEDFMNFQLSDAVAVQDAHSGAVSLARNPKVREPLWAYIKENWERIHAKLAANSVIIDRFVKLVLSEYASLEMEQDIAAFFKEKNTKGYDRGLVQVSDTVKGKASYKERDEKLVLEWLKAHGYVA